MSDFLNPHLTRPAVRWTSGDALPAVEQTGPAAPLLVDATTGRLLVDTEANLSADLSLIESKMDTANGIATTQAADLAAVKTQLATGTIAVTGGGGGGGGASAAYNATLPTYTSGASTVLQTDENGRLITTNTNLVSIDAEAASIDGKLPSLSSGRVPVEANNAASQIYTNSQSGAVSSGTVLIGPIDCAQFREVSVHLIALGTSATGPVCQVSNDGTNWVSVSSASSTSGSPASNLGTAGTLSAISLYSAKNFRIISQGNQTSGTTTLVAHASQQATPKLQQSVSGTVIIGGAAGGVPMIGNASLSGFNTYHSLVSAASVNATSVKSSQGAIGTLVVSNNTASLKWFRLFNKASSPTVGTDTPVLSFPIQPNSSLDIGCNGGIRLTIGIAYAITGGSASAAVTDTTAVAAGDVLVNLTYV